MDRKRDKTAEVENQHGERLTSTVGISGFKPHLSAHIPRTRMTTVMSNHEAGHTGTAVGM